MAEPEKRTDLLSMNREVHAEAPAATTMPWHTMDAAEVAARLATDPQRGLTAHEAAARLARHGPNELQATRRVSAWALFASLFRNVLIVILLVAAGLSAVLGHTLEAVAIAAIMVFAVVLGFWQEFRAERALDALRQVAAPTELVVGDLVVLHTGDKVPADGRVVEAVNLQSEEAALTGESLPVEKRSEALGDAGLPIGDRRNMAYAGTVVTYGRGRLLVTATGMQTEFGAIARMLEGVAPAGARIQRVGNPTLAA